MLVELFNLFLLFFSHSSSYRLSGSSLELNVVGGCHHTFRPLPKNAIWNHLKPPPTRVKRKARRNLRRRRAVAPSRPWRGWFSWHTADTVRSPAITITQHQLFRSQRHRRFWHECRNEDQQTSRQVFKPGYAPRRQTTWAFQHTHAVKAVF